MDVSAQR